MSVVSPKKWARRIGVLIAVPLLFHTVLAAAFSGTSGGTGLFQMRTADTTVKGGADFFVAGSLDTYDAPLLDKDDLDIFLAPGLNYGIGERTEIGFYVSALHNTTISTTEAGHFHGHLTHRFFGGDGDGAATGFSLFGATPLSDNDGISSGDPLYGLELHFDYLAGSSSTHLTLGYGEADTKTVGATINYVSEPTAHAAVGFTFSPSPETILSFEFLASKGLDSDNENIFFVPGLRYDTPYGLEYGVGVAIGVPRDRSEPEMRYLAQLTYRTKGSRRIKPEPVEAILGAIRDKTDHVAVEVEKQSARLAEQTEKLSDLEDKITTMGPLATPTSNALVEVVAGHGFSEIGKQIGKRLRVKGYRVGAVRDIEAVPAAETWVYYRPGYAADAVKLGNAIPKNQNVKRDPNLPMDVDIRVVVGEDLRPANTASGVRVEIIAGDGLAQTASRVAEQVKTHGYWVEGIRQSEEAVIDDTWIYYRPAYAADAVRLGKALPGNQWVRKNPDLPSDVDIRLVIGKDQMD